MNTTGGNNPNAILPPNPEISKTPAEHQPTNRFKKHVELPPGIGGQAISSRLE
ncbi:hypothetical protein [Paenibacillus sp. UNCCL52]|uniref:hypothetical protein n=1 Tax=Paenibacillus sp. UNCCL52 TaxID=1449064 RepID=UPI0018CC581E|nr:hypothetical protein [Paenibacillus sp. UNCCL52]